MEGDEAEDPFEAWEESELSFPQDTELIKSCFHRFPTDGQEKAVANTAQNACPAPVLCLVRELGAHLNVNWHAAGL